VQNVAQIHLQIVQAGFSFVIGSSTLQVVVYLLVLLIFTYKLGFT